MILILLLLFLVAVCCGYGHVFICVVVGIVSALAGICLFILELVLSIIAFPFVVIANIFNKK